MQDTYLLTSINSVGGNLLQLNMTQISWRIELTRDWDEHLMRKILNIYIHISSTYLPSFVVIARIQYSFLILLKIHIHNKFIYFWS